MMFVLAVVLRGATRSSERPLEGWEFDGRPVFHSIS